MKEDITSMADIRLLVDRFYAQVQQDALLAPIFESRVSDWNAHLPKMYAFWASLLLGKEGYQGRPFDKHIGLPIGKVHFERWVNLFCRTVDAHFEGPVAEDAKLRATSIAGIFQFKLKL